MLTEKSLEYCKTVRDGRLFLVTINRPERMNASRFCVYTELVGAPAVSTSVNRFVKSFAVPWTARCCQFQR